MGYIDKVNIKHGSDSKRRFSTGNTLPLVSLPHALASFTLQTTSESPEWFYNPCDRSFEGIRLTHRPSPWIGDFAYFTFMPQAEQPFVNPDRRWSGFRPEDTVLRPDRMELTALRYGAKIRLAPTDSGAVVRIEYDDTVTCPRFAVLPPDFEGEIRADRSAGEIAGYTTSHNGQGKGNLRCYFVFSFDCGIGDCYVSDGVKAQRGEKYSGKAAGINVALNKKCVTVSLAISYISEEQARYNLEKDASSSFEETAEKARKIWEEKLGKIAVKGDPEKEKIFYSCLYRAYLYPTKFYETDMYGRDLHVIAETGEIKEGIMYTNNGFWDTYRTVYPLFSIIDKEADAAFVKAWLNYFDDTGFLPRWTSAEEKGTMPGTLIEAVLADACVKKIIGGEDARRALVAMIENAENRSDSPLRGRKCVSFYVENGYVPFDRCKESVNETLDCAYGDFCIAQVAALLGENETAEKYYKRSKNYAKLYDPETGFMRAKDSNGNFRSEFDCHYWGRDYTEASAWQTTFAVQHDLDGLASLMGGKRKFLQKADALFAEKPFYRTGGYGEEIHEMTEMAAVDLGQCAISNQPSFHLPYLYAAAGEKDKSSDILKKICESVFSSGDRGFPGDEDNGTMACWYIFATMGFYPLCPGKDEYVVTQPMFDEITVFTQGGRKNMIEILKGKNKVSHGIIVG